ncbi:methyl-accepting chemotaxis protein [Salisediminibacterium halotolerans]|nr:methyl-accepting chemotaxis protein [Salisediminibacterium halotolerans]
MKKRVTMYMIVLFTAVMLASTYFLYQVLENEIIDSGVEQATQTVEEIAAQAEMIIAQHDDVPVNELQEFVDSIAANDDFAYAIVIDEENIEAVAHSDTERIGTTYDDDSYTVSGAGEGEIMTSRFFADLQDSWAYDIMVPIEADGELFGAMDVGVEEQHLTSTMQTLLVVQALVIAASVLLFAAITWLMLRKMFQPLNRLIDHCKRIGDGDFTKKISDDDNRKTYAELHEVEAAVDQMQDSFVDLIANTVRRSEDIAEMSEELHENTANIEQLFDDLENTMNEIAQSAEYGAESTENGTKANLEIAANLEESAKELHALNASMTDVAQLSEQGQQSVERVMSSNEHTSKAVNDIADVVQTTKHSTEKIEAASKQIGSIADQTNLLALNASIEAARAGEAGKGFSVVADEIRKLAEQSNRFSQEIDGVIEELTEKADRSVTIMKDLSESAHYQTEEIQSTSSAFSKIKTGLDHNQQEMTAINERTKQLLSQKDTLVEVMENLSALSEENAAGAEQMTSSLSESVNRIKDASKRVEKLSSLAKEMQSQTSTFRF